MRALRLPCLALSLCALLAGGCGSGTPATSSASAVPSPAALNGNWLLTGALPFSNPMHLGGNGAFGLTTTFAVSGTNIVGGGTQNFNCGGFTTASPNVVSGTVAADGTFTTQNPLLATGASLQLTGKAPAAGGTTWSGTYSFNPNNNVCPQTVAGAFNAVRIADVTGVYATAAPVPLQSIALGSTPQNVSLTFTFLQGGALPGTSVSDPQLLSGSVQFQGSSSLSSGTAPIQTGSGVLGSTFVIAFTLNNGSAMTVLGNIEDTGSAKLSIQSLFISSAAQGSSFAGPFEVVRQ